MLAETCVFDKQFHGLFCCGPHIVRCEIFSFKAFHTFSNKNLVMIYKILTFSKTITLLRFKTGSYPPKWGQTLFRSYGRCIAEFLSKGSLVSLSLLDSSTCVGLRYGRLYPHIHLLFLPALSPESRFRRTTFTPFAFPLGWTDTYHESALTLSP